MASIVETLKEIGDKLDELDEIVLEGADAIDDATIDALKGLRQRLTIALKKNPDLVDAVDDAIYDSASELKEDVQRVFTEMMVERDE
jgi:hypothetical protein